MHHYVHQLPANFVCEARNRPHRAEVSYSAAPGALNTDISSVL